MKNILVPTDFSKNTHTAINYAIDLANHVGGKIILFHTYKLGQRAGVFIGVEKIMKEDGRKDMKKQIAAFQHLLRGEASMEGKVIKGEAVPTIIRAAKKLETDLIVMGTQGASGLKEVFIGSTTNGVIKNAKVPVLAVPSDYKFQPLQSIVLPIDEKIKKTAPPLLDILKDIAKSYDASILAFHINTGGDSDGVEEVINELLDDVKHSYFEKEGSVDKIHAFINEFVSSHSTNMLCMIRHSRGFWASLFHNSATTKEVFHSPVPILVIHD